MGNKLKHIFCDDVIEIGGNIKFDNAESYSKFLEALKKVEEEGRVVEVKGVSSISTKVSSGNYEYQFPEKGGLRKVYVGPSIEMVPITLNTAMGERVLQLKRFSTTSEIILETDEKAIVYIKLSVKKTSGQSTFLYRAQPEVASSIGEIVEYYSIVVSFLEYMFKNDFCAPQEEYELIQRVKTYFKGAVEHFSRAQKIETLFDVKFNPAKQNEKENDGQELEELYLLIFEKMTFKYNANLNGPMNAEIAISVPEPQMAIGKKVEMTFSGRADFDIYGEKISIYTANLLANAIIKEIEKNANGKTKIWYADTDNEPMFISYKGFKEIGEREEEMQRLMEHKKEYLEAITVEEYLFRNPT